MLRIRLFIVSIFFCLLFAGAVVRLADLQFYRSAEFTSYRDQRLSQIRQKKPTRGRIIDADGAIVAEDRPTQDLYIVPARSVVVNRRRTLQSNLAPLTVDQLIALAQTRGAGREFELNLAVASLTDGNPLVAELAERLAMEKEDVARSILSGIVAGRPANRNDLAVREYLAFPDIDFALALEIRAAGANPYEDEMWRATRILTGGKRVYPAGKYFGHLTGTVGKLTADEYVELRGRWDEDEIVPGTGRLLKQGREFFSILSGDPDHPSDEERILQLRWIKRSGQMLRSYAYLDNDIVGRGGLEQYYNQALRGRHRRQSLRLSRDEKSGGRSLAPQGDVVAAENGTDINLSIRLDVQKKAYEILENQLNNELPKRYPELRHWTKSGAVVMMDPNNGRIHALISLPSYDPNTFSRDFTKLAGDPALPLVDRTIHGIYPPGSVVKPLIGLAAMTEDVIMPGEKFQCDRVMMLGGARFTCLGRHGWQDLESALMHSCNIYFYHAGERLGGRRIYQWYTQFGLGHRTGIDIAGESNGILPRNAYTRKGWATGNSYHLSIGQGMAVTPLQVAVSFAALANARGNIARIVRPHLMIPPKAPPRTAMEEELAEEAVRMDQPLAEIQVDKVALDTVRQGLWETVQGKPGSYERGTGQLAAFPIIRPYDQYEDGTDRQFFFEIAGKTGTAEWSQLIGGRAIKQTSHVWFAAYAPFDRPELVVVVFLPEAGVGGGSLCAPIAKELIRMWFNLPSEIRDEIPKGDALG